MEEADAAKTIAQDNDDKLSSEEDSDSERLDSLTEKSGKKADNLENDESADDSKGQKGEATSSGDKKNKKQNRGKKGKKNKKEKNDEGTNNSASEKSGQGDSKKKDDSKKQNQPGKKTAAGLVPDKGGMYSLWVKKPYQGYTHEEAYRTFVLFGSIAEINFLEQNFFVKYYTKESAQAAIKRLKGMLSLEPAYVKNPDKNPSGSYKPPPVHGNTVFRDSTPRPTEIYVGNISLGSKQKDLEKLLEDTKFTSLRYHNKNGKGFAFVMYPNFSLAKKAVASVNGKVWQGRALMCRIAEQDSGPMADAQGISLLGNHYAQQPSPSQEGVSVIVRNLHRETQEHHLYTLFSRYGGATYVQTKPIPSKNSVEAEVGLHSDWFAQAAMKELQGQIVDGRMLTISYGHAGGLSGAGHHGSSHHGSSHIGAGHHGSGHHGSGHGSHGHHGNMQNRSFLGPMSSMSSMPPHPHPAVRKLQQASDLAHRVGALVDEVLDDSHYSERIKTLMSELQYTLLEVTEDIGH